MWNSYSLTGEIFFVFSDSSTQQNNFWGLFGNLDNLHLKNNKPAFEPKLKPDFL